MDYPHRYLGRLNFRQLLIAIGVWWLAMLLCYFALYLWIDSRKTQSREIAIELIQNMAKNLSVPLLDRDTSTIQALLAQAMTGEGLLLATVFDHNNTTVALAGLDGAFDPQKTRTERNRRIQHWKAAIPDADAWTGYHAPIHFADVPIGRILVYVSGFRSEGPLAVFGLTALTSLLIIVVPFLASRYRITRMQPHRPQQPSDAGDDTGGTLSIKKGTEIRCPLCGNLHPISGTVLSPNNGDRQTYTDKCFGGVVARTDSEIDLERPSGDKDLVYIRKKVILRCAEIIQKLTA